MVSEGKGFAEICKQKHHYEVDNYNNDYILKVNVSNTLDTLDIVLWTGMEQS